MVINRCNITSAGKAQSVQRLATSWTVRGSNPGGSEIVHTFPYLPWVLSSLLYNGYRVISGGKVAGALITHTNLAQRLKKE
jgi:hypothetical protein